MADSNSLHLFNEPVVSYWNPSIVVLPVVVALGSAGEFAIYPPVELEKVRERAVALFEEVTLILRICPFVGEPTGLLRVTAPVAEDTSNKSTWLALGINVF